MKLKNNPGNRSEKGKGGKRKFSELIEESRGDMIRIDEALECKLASGDSKKDDESVSESLQSESITDQFEEMEDLDFEAARKAPNGVVVMVGDYGGQVYLTCPMKWVRCDSEVLTQLIRDLDAKAWGCNGGDGAGLSYLRRNPGDGIWGGMGGGIVNEDLWVHEEFERLKSEIEDVLQGKSKKLTDATQALAN